MREIGTLRSHIRQLIREMFMISESQKSPEIDNFINDYFRNAQFYVDGHLVPSQIATRELSIETPDSLKSTISQIQSGRFEFQNFYVVKLGEFLVLSTGANLKLAFEDPRATEKSIFKEIANSFLLYVYQDKIFRIIPYNTNFTSDARIIAEVEKYIKSPEFETEFGSRTQRAKFTGEIKTIDFEKKIKIFTDYFNLKLKQKPQPGQKEPAVKAKKSFRANTPLIHKIFGKGVIKSSKKVKEDLDGVVYHVEVDFPDYGLKKIQVKTAA